MKFLTIFTALFAASFVAAGPVEIPQDVTPVGNVLLPRAPAYCTAPTGTCAFYTNCLESKYKCGSKGYPKNYGYKYCNAFSKRRSKFNAKGKKWIDSTMKCLQQKLVPAVQKKSGYNTCAKIKSKAFDSHSTCYVKSGLCTLGASQWAQIFQTVDFKDLFGGWAQLKEVAQSIGGCLDFYWWIVKTAMKSLWPF